MVDQRFANLSVVTTLLLGILLAAPGLVLGQRPAVPAGSYTPFPENLAARQWIQDAKFGIFLHWGLSGELGGGGMARAEPAAAVMAQAVRTPTRQEGDGPYPQLILRNVTVINGTGAPAFGPADVVIEGPRIVQVMSVGAPGGVKEAPKRPKLAPLGKELDLRGHYVMPGIVDLHGHIHIGGQQGVPAGYVYKLWMGHGITTIRDPGCALGSIERCVTEQQRSERNEITAPRIFPYAFFASNVPFTEPEQARRWVRETKAKGALGMKCLGYRPDILKAAFDELKKQGMRSACHHGQLNIARLNVLTTARWGLTTTEHGTGLPETLFDDRTVQNFPAVYNFSNEQDGFGQAGRLWKQAAVKGSAKYEAVITELLALDLTIDPTFAVVFGARDLMGARRAEWHDEYTMPSLWEFFAPHRDHHGSFYFDWGTEDEVAWRENYRPWMAFVNDYKNRGGRVTVGSDAGYSYQLYGFGTIQELEALREAGFHPLEVIRSATLSGAQALGAADRLGTIEPGKLADLAVLEENPLANLKVLYGTGHIRLGDDGQVRRVGGVKYTIKDGIVYDAKQLLADVRAMVAADKRSRGITTLPRP